MATVRHRMLQVRHVQAVRHFREHRQQSHGEAEDHAAQKAPPQLLSPLTEATFKHIRPYMISILFHI